MCTCIAYFTWPTSVNCFTPPHTHTPPYHPIYLGTTVSFEHVTLPKGTFVKLQPVSSVWLVGVASPPPPPPPPPPPHSPSCGYTYSSLHVHLYERSPRVVNIYRYTQSCVHMHTVCMYVPCWGDSFRLTYLKQFTCTCTCSLQLTNVITCTLVLQVRCALIYLDVHMCGGVLIVCCSCTVYIMYLLM